MGIYMSRAEIGNALHYKHPADSIKKIHMRHFDTIHQYSCKRNGIHEYNKVGIMQICKMSTQPNEYKSELLKSIGCFHNDIMLMLNENSNMFIKQNNLEQIIRLVLKGNYKIEREKRINIRRTEYRVDIMIEDKLIVECLEVWHKYEDVNKKNKRITLLKQAGYEVLEYHTCEITYLRLLSQIQSYLN